MGNSDKAEVDLADDRHRRAEEWYYRATQDETYVGGFE